MNAKLTLATLTVLLASITVAAEPKPAKSPTASPAAKAPEVMTDAVDPFIPPKEDLRQPWLTGLPVPLGPHLSNIEKRSYEKIRLTGL